MNQGVVVRFAMLVGVLLLGLVIWLLRPTSVDVPSETQRMLGVVGPVLWLLVMSLEGVLFYLFRSAPSVQRRNTLRVIGWTVAESLPLFGAAVWWLTGLATWYAAGLVMLVLSFVVFPVREERSIR